MPLTTSNSKIFLRSGGMSILPTLIYHYWKYQDNSEKIDMIYIDLIKELSTHKHKTLINQIELNN
jgi:hypothetical protein